MDNDVREAAKRVREVLKYEDRDDARREAVMQMVYQFAITDEDPWAISVEVAHEADLETLADAYLAEHQEDDDEPVTSVWLESIGFERDNTEYLACRMLWHERGADFDQVVRFVHRTLDRWTVEFFLNYQNPSEGVGFGTYRTRGGVRRLLTALGIKP